MRATQWWVAAAVLLVFAAVLIFVVLPKQLTRNRSREFWRDLTPTEKIDVEQKLTGLTSEEKDLLQELLYDNIPYVLLRQKSQLTVARLIEQEILLLKQTSANSDSGMPKAYDVNPVVYNYLHKHRTAFLSGYAPGRPPKLPPPQW